MLPSVALRCKHREERQGKEKEKEEEGRKKGTELWQIQHVFKFKKKKFMSNLEGESGEERRKPTSPDGRANRIFSAHAEVETCRSEKVSSLAIFLKERSFSNEPPLKDKRIQ